MFNDLKRGWAAFKRGHPGSRFQDQHRRQRKEGETNIGRLLRIIAGTVIVLLGIFFLPAPGPGFVIIALGGALLAREFKLAAIVLDRLEVRGRAIFKWARKRLQRLDKARRSATR